MRKIMQPEKKVLNYDTKQRMVKLPDVMASVLERMTPIMAGVVNGRVTLKLEIEVHQGGIRDVFFEPSSRERMK